MYTVFSTFVTLLFVIQEESIWKQILLHGDRNKETGMRTGQETGRFVLFGSIRIQSSTGSWLRF